MVIPFCFAKTFRPFRPACGVQVAQRAMGFGLGGVRSQEERERLHYTVQIGLRWLFDVRK
jgi:hypothetical protein